MQRLSSIMATPVRVVGPEDTLVHARNLLLKTGFNRILVVNGDNKPIGILTKSDMARLAGRLSLSEKDRPIDQVLVEEAMATNVFVMKPSALAKSAAREMLRRKISGVGVVDREGKLVGVVSKSDLTKCYAENHKHKLKVRDVMTRRLVTATRNHTAYRAHALMAKHGVSRIIVMDREQPVGIVTKNDLSFIEVPEPRRDVKFKRVSEDISGLTWQQVRFYQLPTLDDLMTSPVTTVEEEEDLAAAAKTMLERKVSGLPVTQTDGRLVGIVTKTDIVRGLVIAERAVRR